MFGKRFWMAATLLLAVPAAAGAETVGTAFPFTFKAPLILNRPVYTFRFSLFDSAKPGTGTELWRESARHSVPSSRLVTHLLGSIEPFGEKVDFSQQLWVEVAAGSFVKRVKLTPVPYANFASTVRGLRAVPDPLSTTLIGGNAGNSVAAGVSGAVIAGGGGNPFDPGNGGFNEVTGDFGAIGGGWGNRAGELAVVGGGQQNRADGKEAVVIGGEMNDAAGEQSVVLGGGLNQSSGHAAVVAGGCSNRASAYTAFSAGEDANASRRGMFVWSASDDQDPDGGDVFNYNRVFEYDGFPQTVDKDGIPNPLLKDMQFWVKSPGGVFFVTGQDDLGAPLGVMLAQGSQSWVPITASPQISAVGSPAGAEPGLSPLSLQASLLELRKLVAAQQEALAASEARAAALEYRLEDLALRHAELRRLVAAEPRHGSELAGVHADR